MSFSPSTIVQPVYRAINDAIRDLTREQAIVVLEEVVAHASGQIEAIEEEMEDDE